MRYAVLIFGNPKNATLLPKLLFFKSENDRFQVCFPSSLCGKEFQDIVYFRWMNNAGPNYCQHVLVLRVLVEYIRSLYLQTYGGPPHKDLIVLF